MRVSLLLVVMSATTLLAQDWLRFAMQYLQTHEAGYEYCWVYYDVPNYRVLQHEVGINVENIQHCAVRCMDFPYFGMTSFSQCFCGDGQYFEGPVQRVHCEECHFPCDQRDINNRLWSCGSASRMSVYNTERHLAYMMQFPDDPLLKVIYAKRQLQTIENGYYGCYSDGPPHRVLSHQIGRGVRNIQDCAVRCLGFTYSGMEDEDQCFCGNQLELTMSHGQVSDDECYTLCSRPDFNNTEWICGAPSRISVYTTELRYTYMEQFPDDPLWKLLYARQYLQTSEHGYSGCWQDGVGNRVLRHEIGEVGNIQECAYWCTGYRYFGVEDQDDCFCDNRLHTSGSRARVSDNDCSTFCYSSYPWYNNTEWICGAAGRISVYNAQDHMTYLEQFPDDPLEKIVYARQHLQTTANGYFGCFPDSVDNRLFILSLSYGRDGKEYGNIQECAYWCTGYFYFGMEDQNLCFCADRIDWSLSPQRVSDYKCDSLCTMPWRDNSDWICGGPGRMSVYFTEPHLMYMEQFTSERLVDLHRDWARY